MKSKIIILLYYCYIGILFFMGNPVYGGEGGKLPFDYLFREEKIISMDFKDANLKDILKAFSIQSGINFIASKAIEGYTITLYLDKVPVKEALDNLLKANNLSYEFDEEANIILVREAEARIEEMITKIFPLKYISVSTSSIKEEMSSAMGCEGGAGGKSGGKWTPESEAGITSAIKKLLSEKGSVIEDPRTNSLIVTDLPIRLLKVEETIRALDVPVPQVVLEVEMLDVSKSMVDKLGFNFGDNPLTLILSGDGARFFIGDLTKKGKEIGDSGVAGSVIFGNTYASLLDYLREQKDTRYLARPRLLTLNNETAEIKISTQEVIGEQVQYDDQGNITSRTAERTETGVSLRISPQVNLEAGEITMFLSPKVTEAAASAFGGTYRDPEQRGTKTLVKVRDGETVVVGGLIRSVKYETIKKLPILGDVPILGMFFRHRYKEKDIERELLVFITPHIVKDIPSQPAGGSSLILSSREENIPEEMRSKNISTVLNNLERVK